jgi:hypothetical protein
VFIIKLEPDKYEMQKLKYIVTNKIK